MSTVAARIWSQQIVGYCPHTSVDGETWQLIQKGTATSNGASGGTTIIDTSADSGGADTYNGRYWVEMLSGTYKGLWKRIIDDNGSGTLTLENNGFPGQIDSGDEYAIWKSPEPVVVVDSSSGETNVVDAVRTEADVNDAEFWVGYWMMPITGTYRGEKGEITGFDPATGTFTLASGLGGALTAGDVCVLRKFVEATVSQGPAQSYIPRPQNRVNMTRGDGTIGAKSGTIELTVQAIASGSLSASGSVASDSPCSGLFEASGLEEIAGTSVTCQAGCTTTSINIATATWEDVIQAGMAVMHNGNVSFVTAITDGAGSDDVLTVSPAFPVAPADTDVLYLSRLYKISTDADTYGCVIEIENDGLRRIFTGCKGNFTLNSGEIPEFNFSFQADHWIREIEAAPYSPNTAYPTNPPVLESDMVFYLDTTKYDVKGFTATPGTEVSAKGVSGKYGVNGQASFHITNYAPGGTFREIFSSSGDTYGRDTDWHVRTSFVQAAVYGAHGNCLGVRMPVARIIESPTEENADGIAEHPTVLQAQDAGYVDDGGGTARKYPDWALFVF